MRSLALYNWISSNQPAANCEFAHGWWESAEFLQLLSSDFESSDFGVLTSYSMDTPAVLVCYHAGRFCSGTESGDLF